MTSPSEVRDWQHKTLEATTMVAIANIPMMKDMMTSKVLKLPEGSRSTHLRGANLINYKSCEFKFPTALDILLV